MTTAEEKAVVRRALDVLGAQTTQAVADALGVSVQFVYNVRSLSAGNGGARFGQARLRQFARVLRTFAFRLLQEAEAVDQAADAAAPTGPTHPF